MRVLVTGGAGFIGSHLCERLLARGDEVLVLDNFNDFYDPEIKRGNAAALSGAQVVVGDIRDSDLVGRLFDEFRPEALVHLAAMAGVRPSVEDPLLYQDVNVRGTMVLLEALRASPGTRFVFASSSSVYGGNDKVPFSEVDELHRPVSPYAATKRAGELIAYSYHHLFQIPTTCLRFFTVFGPRQRPEMAIHKFVALILKGQPIPFFGDGDSRRDYTYVEDIVGGVEAAIDRCAGYAIYNLGESQTTSLAELVQMIGEVCGRDPILERLPNQPGDVPVTFADISRAQADLDYRPNTAVRDGLERFLAWYLEGPGAPTAGASQAPIV